MSNPSEIQVDSSAREKEAAFSKDLKYNVYNNFENSSHIELSEDCEESIVKAEESAKSDIRKQSSGSYIVNSRYLDAAKNYSMKSSASLPRNKATPALWIPAGGDGKHGGYAPSGKRSRGALPSKSHQSQSSTISNLANNDQEVDSPATDPSAIKIDVEACDPEEDTKLAAEAAAAEEAALATTQEEEEHLAVEMVGEERLPSGNEEAEGITVEKREPDEKEQEEEEQEEKEQEEKEQEEKEQEEKEQEERIAAENAAAEKAAVERALAEKLSVEKALAEKLGSEKETTERVVSEKAVAGKGANETEAVRLARLKAQEEDEYWHCFDQSTCCYKKFNKRESKKEKSCGCTMRCSIM
uniref:Uncharacterized protein n=1 Tax=Polytomella parva TaxID=51329 RepID=A0A7S0V6J6_9CHLO|mmetsp:Transcript_29036/g.53366  ORF Transcript_29036/g.53366 Transcript_29036/m.53366 type:complete len:356 (+) Transcript_29036:98-1165(+)|eukprot:CAMPEP_0175045292 /NCGR_PEP_ID=MMETSP0052_2-20121109/4322_1 /TAXON_ID=51329 ORGANISM="Polytomella parva, Strain SAG 63-3" /NCGR_SAMPLE_ID=MMETSP0052_2 /ASSEMBLY_ACC=CAM_ASM_000194 /LENGTH=355 /DNA_ID=CAMNT_0016308767 /DNA_START=27 /DNA_END=1094 /DNA_ORIENTATION=+